MAEIKLSELRPAGSELLQDTESFLNELSDRELENVVGGFNIFSVVSPANFPVETINTYSKVGITITNITG